MIGSLRILHMLTSLVSPLQQTQIYNSKTEIKNVHKNQVQTLNFKLNITLSAYQKSNERIVFAGAISN